MANIWNERGDNSIDPADIKETIREYHKQHYAYKLNDFEEMEQLLKNNTLPKLTQDERENLNNSRTITGLKFVAKIILKKGCLGGSVV